MNLKLFQIGFLVFLLSNTVQSETLKKSFYDHFLMGTIWHGNKLGSNKNNTINGKEGVLDFFTITSVCFKVLKNKIVDIPAPTAASVKETSTPSNNKKIRADIRLKIVVAIIAENKFLTNIM